MQFYGKNAKVEDYAGFKAICRKKHKIFTNPVFKNPGIYCELLYIERQIVLLLSSRKMEGNKRFVIFAYHNRIMLVVSLR